MQLQNVRPQRLDDIFERRVVGVDGQRHLDRAAFDLLAQFARGLERKMPRRRRKEHKADHVRAGLQRDVERLARGQATNFDNQGHGLSGAGSSRQNRVGNELTGGFYNVAPCLSRPAAP